MSTPTEQTWEYARGWEEGAKSRDADLEKLREDLQRAHLRLAVVDKWVHAAQAALKQAEGAVSDANGPP